MSNDTKKGYVPKTFRDAGTEQTFEGGQEHSFEPGAYANYEAAGLIGTAPDQKTKGETDSKSKSAA